MSNVSILISGVGGQGNLKAGQILGEAAIAEGKKVVIGDTFGMAQRGGEVITHVRIGETVEAPLASQATGNVMAAFEPAECLRHIHLMSQKGKVIVNTERVVPTIVSTGKAQYPENEVIIGKVREYCKDVVEVSATELAKQAGSVRSLNIVMLGCLCGSGTLPLKPETIKKIILETFPKAKEVNAKAFDLGFKAVKEK